MRTFSVKNFTRFQHYKDRSPPWIKLYNELLDDYDFGLLRDDSKFHLIAIWLLASRSENKIPYDSAWVSRRINAHGLVDLDTLAQHGFLIIDQELQSSERDASKLVASCPPEREGQDQDIDGGGEVRARPQSKSLISEDAYSIATEVLNAMGLEPDHAMSVGSPYTVQAWLNGGWPREAILTGVQRAMQSRGSDPPGTLKYFEKAIARQHAELTRPLPKVELVSGEPIRVTTNDRPQSGNIIQAADRLLDKIRSFDAGPDEDHRVRDAAGAPATRLLSQG